MDDPESEGRRARTRPGLRGLRPRLIFAFMVVAVTAGAAGVILALMAVLTAAMELVSDPSAGYLSSAIDLSPALACTVVGLLGYVVIFAQLAARQVLQPVRRLAEAARRLAGGDLRVRLEVHGADEMTDLVRTFNEMAAALERNVGELRRLEAQARRFAADVSHELRTPLAAMIAVTDLLDEQAGRFDGDAAAAARLVSRETRNLNRLVGDLVEISRFDARTATLVVDQINVARVVHDCLRMRDCLDKVTVEVPEELTVRADPRRLDVIIANLVGNALHHGAPPVVVGGSDRHPDRADWISITVTDNGPGMPAEVLRHAFERFYKADAARGRSQGSGLGLAIAWENARLHGGTIEAESRPGGGTVFTVGLPASSGPDTAAGVA